jgi:hypothetical protein
MESVFHACLYLERMFQSAKTLLPPIITVPAPAAMALAMSPL